MPSKTKRELYFAEAQHIYVVEALSIEEIAKRLPVAERTLKTWQEEGGWDKRREDYVNSSQSFRAEFINFGQLLITRVNKKLEAGEDVSASELYTVAKLAAEILRDEIKKEDEQKSPAVASAKEAVQAVAQFLKGESNGDE